MTTTRVFSKIVSGGQTGADQGALNAALKLNHPCGGWCPKGRKSEAGKIPVKYPLTENTSTKYSARTEMNVKDSDGTLLFTYGESTGGTALTVKLAKLHRKPVYVFDLKQSGAGHDPHSVLQWGHANNVSVLNVAGPRESEQPGTRNLVEAVMLRVIGMVQAG